MELVGFRRWLHGGGLIPTLLRLPERSSKSRRYVLQGYNLCGAAHWIVGGPCFLKRLLLLLLGFFVGSMLVWAAAASFLA